jgi:vacuolar-type H+-ATPase subunit E/Vma4
MTSKGSGTARVQPKTERVAEELRQREAEKARELAEAEAARIHAAAEAAVQMDLAAYLRQATKDRITVHLSSGVCDAIRDHARPLRMSHSEIVERGVRMFFRSQLIDLPGPSDG